MLVGNKQCQKIFWPCPSHFIYLWSVPIHFHSMSSCCSREAVSNFYDVILLLSQRMCSKETVKFNLFFFLFIFHLKMCVHMVKRSSSGMAVHFSQPLTFGSQCGSRTVPESLKKNGNNSVSWPGQTGDLE